MRKTFLSCFVTFLAIFLSGIAHAEISSGGINKINELKQKIVDIKQKNIENKTKLKATISSTTEIKEVEQKLKNNIEIKIGKELDEQKIKIADVFEKAIQNLKDLTARIDSRISKMESENIDTLSSKLLFETAKVKLTAAETELTNLENILAEDLSAASTSTPKNNTRKIILKNIKSQSEKTKSSIKAAHKSIINVVTSLKKGLMKKINSTSTIQTTSTTTIN